MAVHPGPIWLRWDTSESQFALALDVASWAVRIPRSPDQTRMTKADIRRLAATFRPGPDRNDFLANTKPGDLMGDCSVMGQSRGVVALWLAAQATPDTAAYFRRIVAQQDADVGSWFGNGQPTPGTSTNDNPEGIIYLPPPDQNGIQDGSFTFTPPTAVAGYFGHEDARYAVQLLDRPPSQVARAVDEHWKQLTSSRTSTEDLVRLLGLRRSATPEERLRQLGIIPPGFRGRIEASVYQAVCP
jgi:hypothetical protein